MMRRHASVYRAAALAAALGLCGVLCATAAGQGGAAKPAPKPPPAVPTYSSPIAMSTDGKLVWSVNPSDDWVSVIRTDQNKVVKKIKVGNEPQGVALDPLNRYAYVANAAGNSLTVLRITDARPGNFKAAKDNRFGSKGTLHHRRRAVERRRLARRQARLRGQQRPGHHHRARRRHPQVPRPRRPAQQPLQRPRPASATSSRAAWPSPPTASGSTSPASSRYVEPGGAAGDDTGKDGRGLPPRHQHRLEAASPTTSRPRDHARAAGHRLHGRLRPATARRTTTSAFPNQLQSIVIRGEPGLPAEHRRLARAARCASTSTRRPSST